MACWFECKVAHHKVFENGQQKKVTEPYLVDALTFTEAEARIIEEVSPYITGPFDVSAVKKVKIQEIFYDETGDKWYQVKYNMITVDEKTAMEKKQAILVLVQASEFQKAVDNFMENMKTSLADFEIASVTETNLLDVFPMNYSKGAEDVKAE
jgi:hypothetical protein